MRPRPRAYARAGGPLTVLGAIAAAASAVVLGIGAGIEPSTGGSTRTVGGAMLGVSNAMIGAGIGLMFAGRATFVTTSVAPAASAHAR